MRADCRLGPFSHLIVDIQQAVEGRASWDSVATGLRKFLDVDAVCVKVERAETPWAVAANADSLHPANAPAERQSELSLEYAQSTRNGGICSRDLETLPRQAGIVWRDDVCPSCGGDVLTVVCCQGDAIIGISAENQNQREALSGDHRRLLGLVLSHLLSSIEIAKRLEVVEARLRGAEALLDRWVLGLIRLDAVGRILECHGAAERLVREHPDLLAVREGHLVAVDDQVQHRFHRLIADPTYGSHYAGPRITLAADSQGTALECLVIAMEHEGECSGASPPQRLMILRESSQAPDVDRHFLRHRLKLSRAEADVLARLMLGQDVGAIAAERGSAPATIRAYIKHICAKLNCHSQGQIISLGWRAVGFIPE